MSWATRIGPYLPKPIRQGLLPSHQQWTRAEQQLFAEAPDGNTSLFIGMQNSARQAAAWAEATRAHLEIPALSMQVVTPATGRFRADINVPENVLIYSDFWSKRQSNALLTGFSHVMIESMKPVMGTRFGHNVGAEVEALLESGRQVAWIGHGSDVRQPQRHRQLEPHSPFHDPLDGLTAALEEATAHRHAIMDQYQLPEFVSSPDQLAYRPQAHWLPTLIDTDLWAQLPDSPPSNKPVVTHIPSLSVLKGTSHIRAALRPLADQGLLEYRELTGIPHQEMPAAIAGADIVIDQVGMGLYGVASLEAMAARRVVVADVWDSSRDFLQQSSGVPLPIVQATPDTLAEVMLSLLDDREQWSALGTAGENFVRTAHSPLRAAATLAEFLNAPQPLLH